MNWNICNSFINQLVTTSSNITYMNEDTAQLFIINNIGNYAYNMYVLYYQVQ